jgi:predicted dehydrogenase
MNTQYKIGFIGCGQRCGDLIEAFKCSEEIKVVALCDPSLENMEHICKWHNTRYDFYTDYTDLIKNADIDLVVVSSPDYLHREHAIYAFEAGKDVFLEKPIAINMEDAKAILKARDESNKMLMIGFVLRYANAFVRLKEIVDSGLIGDIKTAWVLHSVGMGSAWYFHDWHGRMENTAGLLLQKGSHDIDIINWVVNSKAKTVFATGSLDFFGGDMPNDSICKTCEKKDTCTEYTIQDRYRKECAFRHNIDVLDNHQVLIEYENGVKASYMECHYTPDDNREFIFIGTKGKAYLDVAKDKITVTLRNSIHNREEKIEYTNLTPTEKGHGGGDNGITADLLNALKYKKEPLANGEAGINSIEIALAAHQSIREGIVVHL